MDQDLVEGDIMRDLIDHKYINLHFSICQVDLCFDVDLKSGVDRPAQGQRFPIQLSRMPNQGRNTALDPVNGHIVIS